MSAQINILAERLNRGLDSREAAERIGVSQFVLLRAESTGERPKSPRNAKLIADFYGVRVTDIWPVDPVSMEAA